jgi:hypothetical protein
MSLLPKRFRRIRSILSAGLVLIIVPAAAAPGQNYGLTQVAPRIRAGDAPVCGPCITPTLGTFQPTPYLMVRGNWPLGGGYSPLDLYGDQSMALYGPFSPLRATSAPVRFYSRGYNGGLEVTPGTSFSTPNLPALSPVVYPRPANYYYAPRVDRTPPSWSSGFNWIDQQ